MLADIAPSESDPQVAAAENTAVSASRPADVDASATSKTADDVPAVLRAEHEARYLVEFRREFWPVGALENALAADLARRAAAMDRWGEAMLAIERQAARHLLGLASDGLSPSGIVNIAAEPGGAGNAGSMIDAVLSAAMTNEPADRAERHSLMSSRIFLRLLAELRELQSARRQRERARLRPPPAFPDELACEHYLAERLRRGRHVCHRCGFQDGYVLAARRGWECRQCKAQVGLRIGTVMARSAVPLRVWFDAVRWLLWQPAISTAELQEKLGIRRPTTVRTIAQHIRAAMAADNACELLAGLDEHFARR